MKCVYILLHVYEIDDNEVVKNLGVYSSPWIAKNIINKYRELPGFKDLPYNFEIARYKIDKPEWSEGYIKVRDAF